MLTKTGDNLSFVSVVHDFSEALQRHSLYRENKPNIDKYRQKKSRYRYRYSGTSIVYLSISITARRKASTQQGGPQGQYKHTKKNADKRVAIENKETLT